MSKSHYKGRRVARQRKFPWNKILLIFLTLIGIGIIVYTIILLLDNQMSMAVAIPIILICLVATMWSISVLVNLKRHRFKRLRLRGMIAMLIVLILITAIILAFVGVTPFCTAKDTIVNWFNHADGGIATVEHMWVSNIGFVYHYSLNIDLKPTTSALANQSYLVELYEKGLLRDTTTVKWNQPEINVSKSKTVYFGITGAEYDAYLFQELRHIFSVRVE